MDFRLGNPTLEGAGRIGIHDALPYFVFMYPFSRNILELNIMIPIFGLHNAHGKECLVLHYSIYRLVML